MYTGQLLLHALCDVDVRTLRERKLFKFALGQCHAIESLQKEFSKRGDDEVIWLHAASYGEYAIARPIIRHLHYTGRTIVLTVFSPSAYEALKDCYKQEGIDYFFYLPLDTSRNSKVFLDIIRPSKAIFIVSEYWINYLRELNRRNIQTFFVSSLIHGDSYLLKWYGRPILKAIPVETKFMVLDDISKQCLRRAGFHNVTIMGDPLFDNALNIAQTPYTNEIIERFCASAENGLFIAGSISDLQDLKIVSTFANTHRDIKCVFVPHEISEEILNEIKYQLDGWAEIYSDCTPETDFSKRQVLIIDFMGVLSKIYRYGNWAYVGGGFTPYLHSVIEPVVYGLPVAFGPRIGRKVTPRQMTSIGIGKIVKSAKELSLWIDQLPLDSEEMIRIGQTARTYAKSNSGATKKVVQCITE